MDLALFNLSQWYVLAFSTYIFLVFFRKSGKGMISKRRASVAAFIVTAVLSFLAAGRTGIGDTSAYILFFQKAADNFSDFIGSFVQESEWGFTVFLFAVKYLFGNNSFIFLLICSLIVIGGLTVFWTRESPYIELCFLVYIFGGSFVTGMNGVRQSIVASIFVANYRLIRDKKYVPYVIMCLLLSAVHQSALILLPMIFLLNFKPWGKGTWGLLAAAVAMYVLYPLFARVITNLLTGSRYDMYSNGILNFTNGGANILRVAVLLVPIVLAFIFRIELAERFPNYGICLNGAILNFMFMLIASVRSWIFARCCIYFSPFSIALLAQSIQCSGKNKNILYTGCIVAYAVFFYFEMMATIYFAA